MGTTPFAAWEVSAVVALFMAVTGFLWLHYMVKSAENRGEGFGKARGTVPELTEAQIAQLPHPASGFIPLLVVLGTAYIAHEHLAENGLIVALLAGCIALGIANFRYIKDAANLLSDGTYGALMAIGNTSAVVGFGAVAKLSPAFATVVSAMTSMDSNGLIGAAVAITTIAGLTGSASGGQTIALPELAPHYLENGMDPEHLHRITAISSGALDTLPHNGYVVTTIRVICNETHKAAYGSMAALTVVIPLAGLALAIGLINLGL